MQTVQVERFQIHWIYVTSPFGQERIRKVGKGRSLSNKNLECDWMSRKCVTFKEDQSDIFTTGKASLRLPVGARGDT